MDSKNIQQELEKEAFRLVRKNSSRIEYYFHAMGYEQFFVEIPANIYTIRIQAERWSIDEEGFVASTRKIIKGGGIKGVVSIENAKEFFMLMKELYLSHENERVEQARRAAEREQEKRAQNAESMLETMKIL